jgi:hypothetical protein
MLRYLTICKNPILLQLVDIPKCHLEVDELSGGVSVEHEAKLWNKTNDFVVSLLQNCNNILKQEK